MEEINCIELAQCEIIIKRHKPEDIKRNPFIGNAAGDLINRKVGESDCVLITSSVAFSAVMTCGSPIITTSSVTATGDAGFVVAGIIMGNDDSINRSIGGGWVLGSGGGKVGNSSSSGKGSPR